MKESQFVNGSNGIYQRLANRVENGMLAGAPSNASTQATGTGASDFNVNIAAGIAIVDGTVKEFAAQADFAVATSAAQQFASLYSAIYTIIAMKNLRTGVVSCVSVAGTPALTAVGAVALTDDEIDAKFEPGTQWIRLANVTVNRTADTTITQSQDNSVRPMCIPPSVKR